MIKSLARKAADLVGYDTTHVTRTVAYAAVEQRLGAMPCDRLDTLEISAGWKWRNVPWGSYSEMNWPEHDICKDVLDRRFDVIIADNVWEHLLYPYRAARHVLEMLKPGGMFINVTPFLIKHHPIPIDCTRWTKLGMEHFLIDAGFDPDRIETGSWGNAGAVKENFYRWSRTGWRRRLPNDPDFPVTVWAFAHKPT
jgi:hypothetical protein